MTLVSASACSTTKATILSAKWAASLERERGFFVPMCYNVRMPRLDGDKVAAEGIPTQAQAYSPPPPTIDVAAMVPRVRRERVEQLMRIMNDADAVARELGMTREEVEAIDREVRSVWNRRRLLERTERIDEELGYLERIRALALDHYDRSREKSVETSRERKIEPPDMIRTVDALGEEVALPTGRGGRTSAKLVRKVSQRDGELAALRLAMDAGKEIRAMMGIDAPEVKRLQLEGHVTVESLDVGRLAQLGPAELAELHRVALEQSRSA